MPARATSSLSSATGGSGSRPEIKPGSLLLVPPSGGVASSAARSRQAANRDFSAPMHSSPSLSAQAWQHSLQGKLEGLAEISIARTIGRSPRELCQRPTVLLFPGRPRISKMDFDSEAEDAAPLRPRRSSTRRLLTFAAAAAGVVIVFLVGLGLGNAFAKGSDGTFPHAMINSLAHGSSAYCKCIASADVWQAVQARRHQVPLRRSRLRAVSRRSLGHGTSYCASVTEWDRPWSRSDATRSSPRLRARRATCTASWGCPTGPATEARGVLPRDTCHIPATCTL